jgi:O-acetyl-ADP-ribose deacetylase (regulator of RNase III)
MIEIAQGNLLQSEAEALVNTVNCVGVMGKGIALQFKQAYPEMARVYEAACKRDEIKPGTVQVWPTGALHGPKCVINFPTKRHWRGRSRIEDIESGLIALAEAIREHGISSIAVPPLGCGNGGLAWSKVRPMIEEAFAKLPEVQVLLFAPSGAPSQADRVVKTARPKLTRARALFIASIDRYSELAYQVTQLEIQKLAYFLQEAGEPLKLKVEKGPYGPYADNLNKVLETLEGHFISGYDGDRGPEKEISLSESAAKEASQFLDAETDAKDRLQRVGQLIEGFETPYGMELLSSVHFVATHNSPKAVSADEAIEQVQGWNSRKKRLLNADHIRIAWKHLRLQGWLAA